MKTKTKRDVSGRFTVQPDIKLRDCILQIISKEVIQRGKPVSINTIASELLKEGINAKYPSIAKAC